MKYTKLAALACVAATVCGQPAAVPVERAVGKLAGAALASVQPSGTPSKPPSGTPSKTPSKTPSEVDPEANDQPKEAVAEDVQLPEPLDMASFDEFTSQHLTFVEFFLPYCSHCKTLAPKWEQAFKETASEQERIGIHMRQVNCIESSDLCDRESIQFWPNLRLYVPQRDKDGNRISGKLKLANTFPRALKQSPENFKKFMRLSVAEYKEGAIDTPSASVLLDTDQMMKIVAGEISEPHMVAFFLSTDEEWERGVFPRSCMECLELRNDWSKLLNLVLSLTKTGHLNCQSHKALCGKLGLSNLASDIRQTPKYAMFLPRDTGVIRFDYTGEVDVQAMRDWAVKLLLNLQYELVTLNFLENAGVFMTERPENPLLLDYPLDPRVLVVFLYDKHRISEEDKAVLPHLLDMVTKLPHNVRLFALRLVKFEEALQYQAKGLVDFVNSDPLLPQRVEYNNAMHHATTITNKPTILVLKENSLLPSVYQSFAPETIRNPDKIWKFLQKNSYPLFAEFHPDMAKWYFDTKHKENDKIVVTFVDGDSEAELNLALYNVSLVAHQYHYMKRQYYFHQLQDDRNKKMESVRKLKDSGAELAVVIEEMRKEIPHMFDASDALFVYVNLKKFPNLPRKIGWDIDKKGYKPGDAIVVSKDNKYYWDLTLDGEKLTIVPEKIRPVLLHLLDEELVSTKISGFSRKLAASPFGRWFRFLDFVHSKGFWGYVILVVGFVFVQKMLRVVMHKRARYSPGIIGVDKHD